MKLPPYPKYKDSGVPWLGDIPEHWEVRRLCTVADIFASNVDKHTKDGESPVRLCNYMDVYANDRIRDDMDFMQATATAEEISRFKLEVGDVIITKDSEAANDIGVPALVAETAPDLVCGYHLTLLRPESAKVAGEFLLRALQSKGTAHQFHTEAKGVTRFALTHPGIKQARIPLPPLPEQTAIAQYLDEVDQQVQQATQAAQKLIDLLTQQRQAIIHRAVTRGLNPDVPLKPSGIPWLGDIPEHWEARRLKAVADVRLSSVNRNIVEGEELVQFLGTDTVYRTSHIYRDTTLPQASATAAAIQLFALRKGDIVITKDSLVPNRIAVPAVVVEEPDSLSVCGYHLALIRPHEQTNNTPYLFYAFRSTGLSNHFVNMAHGTTIIGIGQGEIGAASVPYPPPDEQVAIAAFLDEAISDIELGMARADQQIQLLQEYRTRLIADVVTGRLDVRKATGCLIPETQAAGK